MSNIVTATFKNGNNEATTKPLTQIDYGQILQFAGIELPISYEVHFANDKYDGVANVVLGDDEGVKIPDSLLQTGQYVYAWVYLHTGEDDGETVYTVTIPVTPRAGVTYEPPTPEEQSVITETLAALQTAVTEANAAQAAAEQAQANAEDAVEVIQDMGVDATTLAPGSSATVEKSVDPQSGAVTLHYGIPRGDQGDKGEAGKSPIIRNGIWAIWDKAAEAYVDTSIPSSGVEIIRLI